MATPCKVASVPVAGERSGSPHRLTVALSTQTAEQGRGRDGIGVYTAALAKHLPGAGVDVTGFSFGQSVRVPGAAPMTLDSYLSYVCRDLVGWRKPFALPADVVHFTDYHIVPCRAPSVATLHDAVPLKYPEWVSPRLRWAKNVIMKRMARHADKIVAVSHFATEELIEYFGVAPERIAVVHGGIDEAWLVSPGHPLPEVRARDGRVLKDYFLCVGTFQPRKNLDNMISAFLSLPAEMRAAHPLVVVGRPGWRCGSTVERLQTLESAGEAVHWLQDVDSREALRAVYSSALALVFVSLYEGFGIPVLEAFATRIPVITSTTSSLPEVAGDAALLVQPADVAGIADAMSRIATSAQLRSDHVAAGSRRVVQFTWNETARKLAAVYASLSRG